jgi:hypothetical protein
MENFHNFLVYEERSKKKAKEKQSIEYKDQKARRLTLRRVGKAN